MTDRGLTVDDGRDIRSEIAQVRAMAIETNRVLSMHVAACEQGHQRVAEKLSDLKGANDRLLWAVIGLGVMGIGGPHVAELLTWLRALH